MDRTLRYAIVSADGFTPSALPPGWRVVARLDEMAVLIEGTGALPTLAARMVEIGPDAAALLMHRP